MNEIKTAIAEIKDHAEHNLKVKLSAETAKIVTEALEKHKPKRIKVADLGFKVYGCPCCDYSDNLWSLSRRDNYCHNCGQAIDWSGEDE